MRNFRRFRIPRSLLVCLAFTGSGVAWAQPAQPDFYVEDPYAPHKTTGREARVGTVAGFLYHEPVGVFAVGGFAAMGYRLGRFTLEAEYTYLSFQLAGPEDTALGSGQRLAALARFDVIRFGPEIVGPNSLLSLYVEGGAGTAWNHWYRPGGCRAESARARRYAATRRSGRVRHRARSPAAGTDRVPAPRRLVSRLADVDVAAPADDRVGVSRRIVQARRDDGRGSAHRSLDAIPVEPGVHSGFLATRTTRSSGGQTHAGLRAFALPLAGFVPSGAWASSSTAPSTAGGGGTPSLFAGCARAGRWRTGRHRRTRRSPTSTPCAACSRRPARSLSRPWSASSCNSRPASGQNLR